MNFIENKLISQLNDISFDIGLKWKTMNYTQIINKIYSETQF